MCGNEDGNSEKTREFEKFCACYTVRSILNGLTAANFGSDTDSWEVR